MSQKTGRFYEFGPFRMSPSEGTLMRGDSAVSLTPKLFELLEFLVENRGRLITKDELMQALWPDSFVEESNLTVNISALRRALGEAPGSGQYIETVPKRGYRFLAEVTGLTPSRDPEPEAEPTPLEQTSDNANPIPAKLPGRHAPSRWLVLGVALVAVAVVAVGLVALARRNSGPPRVQTMAVLPFATTTDSGQDLTGLDVGMADALIMRLSRIGGLVVRPTTAVAGYTGPQTSGLAAAKELGVESVVAGRVHRIGSAVRVTVQLIRASDGATLWAGQFDDYFTNIFAVQDSISERVAEALSVRLSVQDRQVLARRETENVEAYQQYTLGLYHAMKLTRTDARKAAEYFQRAIALDPEYAVAYAGLSNVSLTELTSGAPDPALAERARTASEKAVSLSPNLAEAELARAFVRMYVDWDWEAARRSFARAIELNDNLALAHSGYSSLLLALGDLESALREDLRARDLDPVSLVVHVDLANTLSVMGRHGDAIQQARRVLDMEPRHPNARLILARGLIATGLQSEGLAEAQRAIEQRDRSADGKNIELAIFHALAGDTGRSRELLSRVERAPSDGDSLVLLARAQALVGEREEALATLESAYRQRVYRAIWVGVDPDLQSLRSDPRFQDLLSRIKLTRAATLAH